MAALNKVMLIGNLCKEPELKTTQSGSKVVSFSIATNEKYTDKSGKKQENTEFHNIVVWNRLAEIVEQYAKKGSTIYLEGKITTRSWDDPNGQKHYRTEIVANQIQLFGSKGESKPQASHYDKPIPNSVPGYDDVPMDDDTLPF